MKRVWILAVALFLLGLGGEVNGQKMTAMKDSAKGGYNFWLYEPVKDSVDGKRQPLVIFLHGASLKGSDMRKVLKYGPMNAIDRGVKVNAYVVAPQTPDNWDADKIWKCVEWVKEHYPIDSNKISVVGMSLGGFGTFTLATQYYDKLSAGMMLCGGNTNEEYCGLTEMPFWIMHGTADKAVPISRSNSIVSSMAICGDTSRLLYTKLEGANHSYPAKLFYLTETYDWLTSHSLTDENRAVNRDIKITPEMISGAYGRLTGEKGTVEIIGVPEKLPEKEQEVAPQEEVKAEVKEEDVKKEVKKEKDVKAEVKKDEEKKSDVNNGTTKKGGETRYHIVKKGNTLSQIAQKYHTSVKKLCAWNGIKEDATLRIGQRLKVGYAPAKDKNTTAGTSEGTKNANESTQKEGSEVKKASATSEKKQEAVQSESKTEYHTVVAGETLCSIAKKYNTTVEQLCKLNGIEQEAVLHADQKIKVSKVK